MEFIVNVLRWFLFFLDQIIYSFIATVYNFIELLANTYIFDEAALGNFASNIYAIIAVFMLFRLAFVVINAIIDPEKLTSKEGGVTKMLSKLIVALFLVALIPWCFELAFKLQNEILTNQVLMKVVLGTGSGDDVSETATAGDMIAREALSSFITCNQNLEQKDIDACQKSLWDHPDGAFYKAFPDKAPAKGELTKRSFSWFWDNLTEKKKSQSNVDEYVLDYTPLISTVCGGFILYMLIIFSFEIALRIVKLGFLQLMTPIAVVGYVDPKGTIFNKWLDMVKNTYLNLFIRLLAIYFMVYILILMSHTKLLDFEGNTITGLPSTTILFLKIFIILGSLMFAKEAPKMLSDMLNLGEGSAGDMFKSPFQKMVGGGLIGGAAGLVGGAAVGTAMKAGAYAQGSALGGFSAHQRGGSFKLGAKQGGAAAAKAIPLGGGLNMKNFGKQLGGLGRSSYAGSLAGASGAAGEEVKKVGVPAWLERRQSRVQDEQTMAVAKKQEAEAQKAYKDIEERKNTLKNRGDTTTNPYQAFEERSAVYKNNDYATTVFSVDKAKSRLGKTDLARQAAYNVAAQSPNDEAAQQAWFSANKDYMDAQSAVKEYESQLERMDKMDTYKEDATTRSMVKNYSAKVKAQKVTGQDNNQ